MAEWEELSALQITWTQEQAILRQIVDYAQDEVLVYIICSDSNAVKTYLTSGSVPLTNVKFLVTPFNSIWCRDYGPWTIYNRSTSDSLKIADWIYNRPSRPLDDATPTFVANYISAPIHTMNQAPNNLIATGGNFMVDGHGTGFSSKLIENENPGHTVAEIEAILSSYMGITRYVRMNTLPYDQIHHIDMHMKLLDEETLLVGQYPAGVADGPQIEANLQFVLNNYQTCFGKPYKVVRIPMPPEGNLYPNQGGDYRTYTNSVIVNKTVIVPTYEQRYDTTALRIYRENMPGYRVVGINCNSIIPSLGAIHCITKEIGVKEPVFISHSGLRNTSNTTTPYQVKAYVKTKSGVANAKMFWTTDTTQAFTQVNMTAAGDTFTANIPAQPLNTKLYYYISATSNSGRTVTKPLPAPSGNFRFMVTTTTGVTTNSSNVTSYGLAQNFPNPFNPATTIKYSLPKAGFVKLQVYDIAGKVVRTLTNEVQQPGEYKVDFNAADLTSGVYFYRLDAGEFSQVRKMLLIK
jgi:agmatine/peptidylarginine deiminase